MKRLFIISFFTLCVGLQMGPFLGCQYGLPINEKRYLQKLPSWNREDFLSRKWIQDWESGLSDQNIIRPIVIRIKNYFLYKFLNSSGHESVILGKENSMFRVEYVEASLARNLQQKNRIAWQKTLAIVDTKLQASSSVLILVPSASSATLYPENLPGNLSRAEYGGAIQDLLGLAAEYKNIIPIDTMRILRDTKKQFRTHYAMDYHWNTRGSLHVLLDILQRLKEKNLIEAVPALDLFQSKPTNLLKNYTSEILSIDQMVSDVDEQFSLKSIFFLQTVKNSPIILIGDSFSTAIKNNLDLIGFGRFHYQITYSYSLGCELSLKPFKNAIIIWVFSEEKTANADPSNFLHAF